MRHHLHVRHGNLNVSQRAVLQGALRVDIHFHLLPRRVVADLAGRLLVGAWAQVGRLVPFGNANNIGLGLGEVELVLEINCGEDAGLPVLHVVEVSVFLVGFQHFVDINAFHG